MTRVLRYGAVGLMLLALGGCLSNPPVQSMALLGGEITVTPPRGYCLDAATSRSGDGFAVMAPCATLGGESAVPSVLGVATVQVGAPGSGAVSGAESNLRDLLVSSEGAALLSTKGSAADIKVLGSQVQNNVVKIHFTDTAPPPLAGLQAEEWRAFTDMNGRLVTVAVRGLENAPLSDGGGAWLLDRMIAGLTSDRNDEPDGS